MHIYNLKRTNQHGFSLLEILIALVIVGILSVIAVNRYTERSEEARINAAKSELKAIAEAERQVEIDTGYYITLRAMDDSPGVGSFIETNFTQYRIESEPQPWAFDSIGFYLTQYNNFPYAEWRGPYINYQSVDSDGDPKDPWGNRYRLFTEVLLSNPTQQETGFQIYLPSDRMRIVSYGKDGVPSVGDDIVYKF